jgi:ABC-type amino acid transport substrate-binding protein
VRHSAPLSLLRPCAAHSRSDVILLSARDHKLVDNVIHVRGEDKAAQAFDKGEVVAFYGESALVEHLAHQASKPISIVYPEHRLVQSWPIGGAVKADAVDLADAIDKEIGRMAESGDLQKIFASYGVAWRRPSQER